MFLAEGVEGRLLLWEDILNRKIHLGSSKVGTPTKGKEGVGVEMKST